jgi:cystathionine gamma-synthase
MTENRSPRTIAAANGIGQDAAFGAVAPPIYLASSYKFGGFERPGTYDYSRTRNPTRDQLGDTLAKLEGGAGAVVVASGMAAIDLVLSRLEPGERVVAPHDCYGGTQRLLSLRAAKGQFDVVFIDQNDAAAVDTAIAAGRPKLVLIETPSNPLMRVVDIAAIAKKAKAAGIAVAVDNTFLSPALQQPIALGADFVIHSTTKYLNGHSDVVGGAVIAAEAEDAAALAVWANVTGVTGSPFDAYQTLRGIRTLFPRIESQQRNAEAVAAFLDAQPQVKAVHYPGLPSHPGFETARRQQRGFGAMLSFELGGGLDEVRRFVNAVRIFTLAESLGGIESLVAHPAAMTHASMDPQARRIAGITDTLLRLSVGLESESDLLGDLAQALRCAENGAEALAP